MSYSLVCSGQLNSGKDLVSDYLVNKLNYLYGRLNRILWKKYALAYNVKKIFCQTFNVSHDFIEEWKRKDEIPLGFNQNIRKSLIFIGDGFRKISEDIWIQLLLNELDKSLYNAVISDGRYFNEIKSIKSRGGLSILIWRPGYENTIQSESEQQLVGYRDLCIKMGYDGFINNLDMPELDFFIVNNSSIEDLYEKLDKKVLPLIIEKFNL